MTKNSHNAFNNFLEDHFSKDDYLEVIRQFENDEEFQRLKVVLEENWNAEKGGFLSDESYKNIQLRVREEIISRKYQEKNRFAARFLRSFNRVAAFLLIPLFIVSAYFFMQWQDLASNQDVYAEIYCPAGTRTKFNLSDGTTGWLNSNSSLKYPVHFKGNRHLILTGEAWFDVKKDKNSPFSVKAGGIDVEALGTKFNVLAYSGCSKVEVSLEEGSVKVTKDGSDLNEILKPDQRLVHDGKNNLATVFSDDTDYFTSWKDGYIVFRNVPLSEVASRLGQWYNAEIVIQDKVLENIPFRATFKNESLERVLSLLAMSTPIAYQIIEPQTNKKGIYEKQKVVIRYKN
jgi:ferric-dicitrate binding protein FerR (iron transport regulator)